MPPADPAPADRFCDLVMKGGITSGIVYPLAIGELSRHYRFRSIGGTSAGAIAAAATAAAEYQRRNGSNAGFDMLANLPGELQAKPDGRISRLMSLFQPQAACRRLFTVLLRALNRATTLGRTAAIVGGLLEAYWPAALASLLLGALACWFSSVLAGVLTVVVALCVFIAIWVYRDVTRNMVGNGFGLCNGATVRDDGVPALVAWLHELIQRCAGRTVDDAPLTFGDLWNAPGFPPDWVPNPAGKKLRSIDLQMFTTNLTHGRPYIFPHTDRLARLFYSVEELHRYLPAPVLEWLNAHAIAYQPADGDPPAAAAAAMGLREIPPPEHFPVVVAARMSLSFPLLLSAVPLWAIDYERMPDRRTFHRCWFSDGGLSSNFPMHLFDGLLPTWPTFGIQLEDKLPDRDNLVYLPQHYRQGYADRWNRFDQKAKSAARFGGFLMGIVTTMQNWNDNTLARMPGVRDRVVRLRLHENEGGLNLNMPQGLIDRVSKRGAEAALAIVNRFVPKAAAVAAPGWDEQRWVRLDVLVRMLEKRLPGVLLALAPSPPHATSYQALLARAQSAAPPGHDAPLQPDEAAALAAMLGEFEALAAVIAAQTSHYVAVAVPEPELRVRPPN